MTEQQPDAGDSKESTDTSSTPHRPDEIETAAGQSGDADTPPQEGAPARGEGVADTDDAAEDGQPAAGADETGAAADGAGAGIVAETEAEAADAAAAGAAWTTTPVAPDPEATEAALAALAAKPELTIEPPEGPPVPPGAGGEPPDEGTPVLLVGGILVGAFIVALAIVLILFRPFDSVTVEPSPSPSPVVTEVPSASPTAIPVVDTPNFQGRSLLDAEALADDYGLVVRANPVETDDFEQGTVLNQEPAPGEAVEPGSIIELAYAVPVPTSPVPDVVGLSEDEAIEIIEDAGFVVADITVENSDEIEAGYVIRTEPDVDSELPSRW